MTATATAVFLVDASVWISAHGKTYPPDVFPRLWNDLRRAAEKTQCIKSPRQVIKELGDPKKDIGAWVKSLHPSISVKEDGRVQTAVGQVLARYTDWATHQSKDIADPWLVAHGSVHGYTIVTEEKSAPLSKATKIPDACRAFNVECINSIEMFRRLKIKL